MGDQTDHYEGDEPQKSLAMEQFEAIVAGFFQADEGTQWLQALDELPEWALNLARTGEDVNQSRMTRELLQTYHFDTKKLSRALHALSGIGGQSLLHPPSRFAGLYLFVTNSMYLAEQLLVDYPLQYTLLEGNRLALEYRMVRILAGSLRTGNALNPHEQLLYAIAVLPHNPYTLASLYLRLLADERVCGMTGEPMPEQAKAVLENLRQKLQEKTAASRHLTEDPEELKGLAFTAFTSQNILQIFGDDGQIQS